MERSSDPCGIGGPRFLAARQDPWHRDIVNALSCLDRIQTHTQARKKVIFMLLLTETHIAGSTLNCLHNE